jgi:hypothetical protein
MWVICIEDKRDYSKQYVSGFDVAQGRILYCAKEEATEYESEILARNELDVIRPIVLGALPNSVFFIDEL